MLQRALSPFMQRACGVLTASLLCFQSAAWAQDRPTVIAVNYALSYFAERLGGDAVEVVFPVPEGVDPEFWRPSVSDISAMQAADVILLNGAGFATWVSKASLPRARLVDTSRSFKDRYISTETVTHSHGADGAHSHTATASFTWLDQDLAIVQTQAIAAALASRGLLDPDEIYRRLTALTEDLTALATSATALGGDGAVLIATHPRYQYFARAYGLDIRALEWDAGAAPTAAQLEDLRALKEATGAQILLWEATPPESARADIAALGMADLVFPTFATDPGSADYLSRFTEALEDLSATLNRQEG